MPINLNETMGNIIYKKFIKKDNNIYLFYINNDGEMVKDWLCSEFSVDKVRYNEETKDFSYDLIIKSLFGETTCCVSKGLFTYKRFNELAEKGLNYNDKNISQIIEYVRCEEQQAEHVMEYTFVGWNDNKFSRTATANKEYVGDLKLAQSSGYDYETLNKLLEDAYGLQFALTVGCSSALLGYLGQKIPLNSPIVHFYGDTSLGKTTALQTAVSMWGKPDIDSGMLSTWNQTENCLMNRLCNNFALPIALDESSICKYDMTSFIYNFSQGVNRQRLMKTGKQTKTKQWLCPILSSGESSILEQSNSNNGLSVRIFEFSIPITKSASHSNEVKDFVNQNYGYIGKKFIITIGKFSFDKIKNAYSAEKKKFIDSIPKAEYMPTTDRLSDYYALWMLTARILHKLLKINVEPEEIKKILLIHHQNLNDNWDTGEKVYNIILDRITNKRNLYPDKNEYFGQSIEGVVFPDGEVAIIRPVFEQILKEHGFTNKHTVFKSLAEKDLIKKQRSDTYYSFKTLNQIKTSVVIINISKNYERTNHYEIYKKNTT